MLTGIGRLFVGVGRLIVCVIFLYSGTVTGCSPYPPSDMEIQHIEATTTPGVFRIRVDEYEAGSTPLGPSPVLPTSSHSLEILFGRSSSLCQPKIELPAPTAGFQPMYPPRPDFAGQQLRSVCNCLNEPWACTLKISSKGGLERLCKEGFPTNDAFEAPNIDDATVDTELQVIKVKIGCCRCISHMYYAYDGTSVVPLSLLNQPSPAAFDFSNYDVYTVRPDGSSSSDFLIEHVNLGMPGTSNTMVLKRSELRAMIDRCPRSPARRRLLYGAPRRPPPGAQCTCPSV